MQTVIVKIFSPKVQKEYITVLLDHLSRIMSISGYKRTAKILEKMSQRREGEEPITETLNFTTVEDGDHVSVKIEIPFSPEK